MCGGKKADIESIDLSKADADNIIYFIAGVDPLIPHVWFWFEGLGYDADGPLNNSKIRQYCNTYGCVGQMINFNPTDKNIRHTAMHQPHE